MQRIDGENWLRLHIAGRDAVRLRGLIRRFGSATRLIEQKPETLFADGTVDKTVRDRLIRARSDEVKKRADETVEICRRNGWRIITPQSPLYPECLLKLRRFPFVLYADGDTELLNQPVKCAIVGTRAATQNARALAFKLAYGLSNSGAAVVSGGALGIDAAAHEGALAGKSGTVAVLGAGLGSGYLQKNAELRNRISTHGVLVTELDPFETPTKYTFPERNRIIASLGDVCCVVQSGKNGGSLITADRAAELGRPIAVPSENTVSSDGCDVLIQRGAHTFSTAAELLGIISKSDGLPNEAFLPLAPDYDVDFDIPGFGRFLLGYSGEKVVSPRENSAELRKPTRKAAREEKKHYEEPEKPERNLFTSSDEPDMFTMSPMSEEEKRVLSALTESPVSLDRLTEITGLGADAVTSALTLLELRGKAASYYGNLYSLTAGAE